MKATAAFDVEHSAGPYDPTLELRLEITMRFMIIVKAAAQTEAAAAPTDAKIAEMERFHAELTAAGVLVDYAGLQASDKGWRVHYDGNKRSIVDGPFVETKELIAGYTIIRTATRDEALAWTRRFPNPNLDDSPCHIEVRQMFEPEDFDDAGSFERARAA